MKKAFSIMLLCLWAIFFLAMHLSCFDLFGDNLWFYYVIAGVLLFCQFLVITAIHRYSKARWIHMTCFAVYSVASCAGIFVLGSAFAMHDPSPHGLTIWCLFLDVIGGCYCISRQQKNRKRSADIED